MLLFFCYCRFGGKIDCRLCARVGTNGKWALSRRGFLVSVTSGSCVAHLMDVNVLPEIGPCTYSFKKYVIFTVVIGRNDIHSLTRY